MAKNNLSCALEQYLNVAAKCLVTLQQLDVLLSYLVQMSFNAAL